MSTCYSLQSDRCKSSPLLLPGRGGSHHAVRAEAAEDADGADHLPVQVCLPGSHPVPQELPPHLNPRLMTFDLTRRGNGT